MAKSKKQGRTRANGEGTWDKTAAGYRLREWFEHPISREKFRKSFTRKTKTACLHAAEEYKENLKNPAFIKELNEKHPELIAGGLLSAETIERNIKVGDWIYTFLDTTKEHTVDKDTLKNYKSTVKTIVDDSLGKMRVVDVRPIHIQGFFNRHAASSQSYIKKWYMFLFDAFDYAVDNDIIYKNPVKGIRLPEGTTQSRELFSDTELETIEQFAFTDDIFGCAMLVLLYGGLRSGEVPPLKAGDIDSNDILHITWSLTASGDLVSDNRTKQHKGSVPLPHYIAEHIRGCREPEDYIVVNAKGGRLCMRTWHEYYNKFFNRMDAWCDERGIARVRHIKVHSTRHTYSTTLYSRDVHFATQRDLMRQKNIKTTSGYTHEVQDKKVEAVRTIFPEKKV